MRTGLDVLTRDEGVSIEVLRGHGGYFKTPVVGQKLMAAATATAVRVAETAGEGGAWGMALLAAFMSDSRDESLPDYLDRLFADNTGTTVEPDPADVQGFEVYFRRYTNGLPIERASIDSFQVGAP
jgi:sugar (pentulose or hexulose) kinase